ncbi:MAG: DUF1585 domain-containing protein [Pseudomonadota bacterium]
MIQHRILLFIAILTWASSSWSNEADQAKRIHDRIAGVPPISTTLNEMVNKINQGDELDAAFIAIENSNFYNVTLKNFVTPWTNKDQSIFIPLNDYSATVIGLIRDDADFRQVLSADIIYVGNNALGLPAYSNSNNNHYLALVDQGIDLKTGLQATTQSSVTGLNSAAIAGILTTRAASQAFFYAGTNRAMLRFTLMNYLCKDLEQLADTTRPPDRIRQDVSRSPGGDSRLFLNNCIGCHSGMDPLAQAFAYYEWEYNSDIDPTGINGQLIYNNTNSVNPITGTRVQSKYHINSTTFPYGYVTPNDQWDNYWRKGQNQNLGWSSSLTGTGNGAKSLGQELAASEQFASCQVEKVFTSVCLRKPLSDDDKDQISAMTQSFKTSGYKLKQVFAESAVYCMGD